MTPNTKFAERVAILATLDPISQSAATVTTGWVSMANFHQIAALIQTGTLGTSATVDAKLQQATSSGGAGAKDITGKALTQIVKASGDNKQAIIEVRGTELDAANGFVFVRLSLTVGTAASLVSAVLLGTTPQFMSAAAFDQAGVVQLV